MIATITYEILAIAQPEDLSSVTHHYNPVLPLCSSSLDLLESSAAQNKFSPRAFSHAAPKIRNSLKLVKDLPLIPESLATFRKAKTELFKQSY